MYVEHGHGHAIHMINYTEYCSCFIPLICIPQDLNVVNADSSLIALICSKQT
jgi:hypothetical protein